MDVYRSADELRARKERLAGAIREKQIREERRRQSDLGECGRAGGLLAFVRHFWHILEPNTKLVVDMQMEAICLHLEAVARGEIKRLLINVSPGAMKSLLVNVFFPAWLWGPANQPWLRFVTFAYAAYLTERDNIRFRDIIRAAEYQELWSDNFILTAEGQIKPANNHKGWKFSSSMLGVGTGERGDYLLADDLHNIIEGESEAVRSTTVRWSREGMSNRLNDMVEGVIIMIGQRVHEDDVSNAMLVNDLGFVHLCIPFEYDPSRRCANEWWQDPRAEPNELASPIRFPPGTVAVMKRTLGPYAWASQYQQSPEPRGGGILKRDWWVPYELAIGASPTHSIEFRVASLDPAFTAKQENDPSGFTVWGLYYEKGDPRILALQAWKKWLELHGQTMERLANEDNTKYVRRASPHWGLVEWVAYECKRLNVNLLLIENKASGHSVAQEMQRLYANSGFDVLLVDPGTADKRARAYAIQHLFAAGVIAAPASVQGDLLVFRDWAQVLIDECAKFRGLPGDEDNLVDATCQAVKYLRDIGLAMRHEERDFMEKEMARYKAPTKQLYPV